MIQVRVEKENAKYKKIKIIGHAMYDDYGKDIVCSKKGMTIDVKSEDRTTQLLIKNMIKLLKELSGNYPNNIEVK